jgi:hypothetical protein
MFNIPTPRRKPDFEPSPQPLRREQLSLITPLPAGYVAPSLTPAPPPTTARGITETLLNMFESTMNKRAKPPSKYELKELEKVLG